MRGPKRRRDEARRKGEERMRGGAKREDASVAQAQAISRGCKAEERTTAEGWQRLRRREDAKTGEERAYRAW